MAGRAFKGPSSKGKGEKGKGLRGGEGKGNGRDNIAFSLPNQKELTPMRKKIDSHRQQGLL